MSYLCEGLGEFLVDGSHRMQFQEWSTIFMVVAQFGSVKMWTARVRSGVKSVYRMQSENWSHSESNSCQAKWSFPTTNDRSAGNAQAGNRRTWPALVSLAHWLMMRDLSVRTYVHTYGFRTSKNIPPSCLTAVLLAYSKSRTSSGII